MLRFDVRRTNLFQLNCKIIRARARARVCVCVNETKNVVFSECDYGIKQKKSSSNLKTIWNISIHMCLNESSFVQLKDALRVVCQKILFVERSSFFIILFFFFTNEPFKKVQNNFLLYGACDTPEEYSYDLSINNLNCIIKKKKKENTIFIVSHRRFSLNCDS